MRVSADKDDPCYRWDIRSFTVFFNGRKRTHVLTADEERGYIIAYVLTEDGEPAINGSGAIRYKQEFGEVLIDVEEGHELTTGRWREEWQRKSKECMQ